MSLPRRLTGDQSCLIDGGLGGVYVVNPPRGEIAHVLLGAVRHDGLRGQLDGLIDFDGIRTFDKQAGQCPDLDAADPRANHRHIERGGNRLVDLGRGRIDVGGLGRDLETFGGLIQPATQDTIVINAGELGGCALDAVCDTDRLEAGRLLVCAGDGGHHLHQVAAGHVLRGDGRLTVLLHLKLEYRTGGGERIRQSHGLVGSFAGPEQDGIGERVRCDATPVLVEDVAGPVDRVHGGVRRFKHLIPAEEEVLRGEHGLHLAGRATNPEHGFRDGDDAIRDVRPVDMERRGEGFDVQRGDHGGRGEQDRLGVPPRGHPGLRVVLGHGRHWTGLELVGDLLDETQQRLRVRLGAVRAADVGRVDAIEPALARVFRETLGLHEIHVVTIAQDRRVHDLTDVVAHARFAVERGQQSILGDRDRVIMVERERVEHAGGRETVATVHVVTKVLLVKVAGARLDQTHRGLLIGGAVALQGARGADELQRIIPISMLNVEADKSLDQNTRELITQIGEVAHGVHRVADIALRGGGDAHLELRAGGGANRVEDLNVALVSQWPYITHGLWSFP